jgi:flavorubredoxin
MKAIIIYNTMSGNTEELANKMKLTLEKYNHTVDIYRDKNVKDKIKRERDFLKPYDLLCLGSCTHAKTAAFSFKKFLKIVAKQNLENKKLICFGTSGGANVWKKTCESIENKLPQLEHIGNIGCLEKENEDAVREFEEIIKKL